MLADAGVTTLLVTHDQEEALSIADQIAVMRDGRFTQVGAPQDVYRAAQRPLHRRIPRRLHRRCRAPSRPESRSARSAGCPCRRRSATGPRRWRFGPNSLSRPWFRTARDRDGVGTVIATEFLGHDVLLTIDPAGDIAPIIVRQHSLNPPPIDAKVRIEVMGNGVVLR